MIAGWQPDAGQRCRVLIGMQRPPHEEVRALYQVVGEEVMVDNARASEIKHKPSIAIGSLPRCAWGSNADAGTCAELHATTVDGHEVIKCQNQMLGT